MKKAILIFLTVTLAGCVVVPGKLAKDGKPFQSQANISGTITTGAMMRQPALADRELDRIGVLTDESVTIGITNVALTIFGNTHEEYAFSLCLNPDRLSSLFVQKISSIDGYEAVALPTAYGEFTDVAEWSTWHAAYSLNLNDPEVRNFVNKLQAEHGIDSILVVAEKPVYDFVGGTAVRLNPKGLYGRMQNRSFAYASFDVRIIDLDTGEQVEDSSYVQGSFWGVGPVNWDVPWAEQPEPVSDELCRKLNALDVNNADRALWMLRINTDKEPFPEALITNEK